MTLTLCQPVCQIQSQSFFLCKSNLTELSGSSDEHIIKTDGKKNDVWSQISKLALFPAPAPWPTYWCRCFTSTWCCRSTTCSFCFIFTLKNEQLFFPNPLRGGKLQWTITGGETRCLGTHTRFPCLRVWVSNSSKQAASLCLHQGLSWRRGARAACVSASWSPLVCSCASFGEVSNPGPLLPRRWLGLCWTGPLCNQTSGRRTPH